MGNGFDSGGDTGKVVREEERAVGLSLLADAVTAITPKESVRTAATDVALGVTAGTVGGLGVGFGKTFLDMAIFDDFKYPVGNRYLTLDYKTRELSPGYVADSVKSWIDRGSPAAEAYRNAVLARPEARSVIKQFGQVEWEATDAIRDVLRHFHTEREALRTTNRAVAESNELFTAHMIEKGLAPGATTHSRHILESARDALAKKSAMADDVARATDVYAVLKNPAGATFRPTLTSHAFKGAIAAAGVVAADYAVSEGAKRIFGEDSAVAQVLRTNPLGTGMTAMAFVAPTDWRTRAIAGTATWAASKGLNVGFDYLTGTGMFANQQLKPELSMKYSFNKY